MKAWIAQPAADGIGFELGDIDAPEPAPDELLVRVCAAGINRVDQRANTSHFSHSPAAPVPIPGLEMAGEVVQVGSHVSGFDVGARVAAMVQGGCAEYVRVKAVLAMRLPAAMSWTVAAALPVSYLTAHNALVMLGRLQPGDAVLIHAVTTGDGLAALQLAARGGASQILGSSGSAAKLEQLRERGLDHGLHDPYAGFAPRVLALTSGLGVPVVVDNIGGSLLDATMSCTALGGRIVNVGRLGGVQASIDLNLHALRRIELLGATFRTRTLAEHAAVVNSFMETHGQALADGSLAPLIDRVFAFDDLPDAVRHSAASGQLGKIVVAF